MSNSLESPGTRRRVRVLFGCAGWPSGMFEVASWAKRQQLAETIIRQIHDGEDGDVDAEFTRKLIGFRPHVVGFRVEGEGMEQVKRWIAAVRRHSDAEIVLGGPTATSHPLDVLIDSGADYVFAGEAEEPFNQFLRLARQPNSKDRQPEIPGLAYRYGGRAYLNTLPRDGYERSIMDVDNLICCNSLRCLRNKVRPVAKTELIAANQLDWSLLENFSAEFDSLYFTGGRGCPGACVFCAKLHGNQIRAKSAEQLLEEIEAADRAVSEGALRVTLWKLFQYVDDPSLKNRRVAWASIFDEDFFLDRRRAIDFFRLWNGSPLKHGYRIALQTNPCSMLAGGEAHRDLVEWIDRLKPMIHLGAESFHNDLLLRWHKRHSVGQLNTVLNALDATRQDYTVFQLLTDFETTPEELVETLRRLILAGYKHRRMRIASSPFTIPLYESDTRRLLEYGGRLAGKHVCDFRDYERPQPGWMDPLAAELADLADAELRFALDPEYRDGALCQAFEVVYDRICREPSGQRANDLRDQAGRAMAEIKAARFQGVAS